MLPHLLKQVVDQERPDRTVMPPRHGIPKSGNPYDAFPSGHAMHIGAIASAMSRMYPKACGWIWLGGLAVASTRIALLAHWTSDVVAGPRCRRQPGATDASDGWPGFCGAEASTNAAIIARRPCKQKCATNADANETFAGLSD